MPASWLILLLTAYLSLDVANPLMPGALTFGVEESVELRHAERFRSHHDVVLLPAAPPSERVRQIDHPTVVRTKPAPDVAWSSPPRMTRARSSLFADASPSEDH